MDLVINGKTEKIELTEGSITELLKYKKVEMPEMVSVEYNGEFIKQAQYSTIKIKDGDKIEFLYFMGGGTL